MANLALCAMAVLVTLASSSPLQQPFVMLDLTPEEAQRYLSQPLFPAPVLSTKTATLPLIKYSDPRFRASDAGPTNGHYWKNGNEIENTDDYVEDVYEASQFHGQDGLGAAAFGYSAPESSRLENIQAGGNVQGSYTYKDPFERLIQVKYWADEDGFHQEDNLPKVELQPAQETAEVREARLAHEKAWQEAAALAAANPDPSGEYDPSKYEASEYNEERYQPAPPAPRQQKTQQYSKPKQSQQEEEENNGPPRGFFYSFKYPVSIIVSKNQAANGPSGLAPGQFGDDDTVGVNAQPQGQNPNARFQTAQRPQQIHDAQVPRYRNY